MTKKRSNKQGRVMYLTYNEMVIISLLANSGLAGDKLVGPEIEGLATKITALRPDADDAQAVLWRAAGMPMYKAVAHEP